MIEARLFDYLLSHKALPLQDLGVLKLLEEEAAYDVTTNQYLPPRQRLVLYSDETESLQPLMRHLAREQGQTEEQVYEAYQEWIQQLQHGIQENGSAAMKGLGTFRAGNPPVFDAWASSAELLPASVLAHRVVKAGAMRSTGTTSLVAADSDEMIEEETLPPGHFRWMIGAIVLLLAGITLIALRTFGVW